MERGEFDRLAVSAPPGSAKTTYVSHLFPPWYLARNPEHLVLVRLAHAGICRAQDRPQGSQPDRAAQSPRSASSSTRHPRSMADWALTSGGGYRAVGVGVAVAGERADLGLVEDPFARWEDAQRPLVQEECWEWYDGRLRASTQAERQARHHHDAVQRAGLARPRHGARRGAGFQVAAYPPADDCGG